MNILKLNKLKILGASIVLILLLIPGITLAEQAVKMVYKMVVTDPVAESSGEDAGDPITTDSEATIEQGLNTEAKSEANAKIQEQELYGNKLAFVDAGTQELIGYDLKNKEKISISKDPNLKEQLAMFKNHLVWNELNQIWAYDFSDGSIVKVSDKAGDLPDIYGDQVVYRGVDQAGIYIYNFKTKKTLTISEKSNGNYMAPSIWKNIITWADDSDGYLNVYYYDLKNSRKTKVTNFTEERYVGNPIATKKSIVYPLVDEDGVRQLMEYDLKNGGTITIPGLKKGKFRITVDKYDGGTINYYRTYDEVVTIDLDTKKVKEYEPIDNKAMYGGVIIGTEKDVPRFKVHRDN